jgi:aryl-phospho-beta-D-glucosidase BglC (GH1 family)
MKSWLAALALSVFVAHAIAAPALLASKNRQFVDSRGNAVQLRGLNYNLGDHKTLFPFSPKHLDAIRRDGFNVIRLPVYWQFLEPRPGQIDDAYLRKIEEIVAHADNIDLYVVVDMHQWNTTDCFDLLHGIGFPGWFVTEVSKPAIAPWTCAPSDLANARWKQNVFWDQFWKNNAVSIAPYDGMNSWEVFAHAWGVIAGKLRNYTNVVGWDLLNEPHIGSQSIPAFNAVTLKTFYEFMGARIRRSDGLDTNPKLHHIIFIEGQDGDVKAEMIKPALANMAISPHVYPPLTHWGDDCLIKEFIDRGITKSIAWNVPYLAGEFGTNGHKNDDDPETTVMMSAVTRIVEAYGQSWVAWSAMSFVEPVHGGFYDKSLQLRPTGVPMRRAWAHGRARNSHSRLPTGCRAR